MLDAVELGKKSVIAVGESLSTSDDVMETIAEVEIDSQDELVLLADSGALSVVDSEDVVSPEAKGVEEVATTEMVLLTAEV